MYIKKLTGFKITCPHCGSEIAITMDEFRKYREEVAGYSGSVVTCQREDKDGKSRDINYVNMDCPICDGYIPTIVDDNDVDSDEWGFCFSPCVEVTYGNYDEMTVEDYMKEKFGGFEENVIEEE